MKRGSLSPYALVLPALIFVCADAKSKPPTEPPQATENAADQLGLSVETLTPDLAKTLHIATNGVLISSVRPNGEAAEKGLRRGDIITSINSVDIVTPSQLAEVTGEARAKHRSAILMEVFRGQNVIPFTLSLMPRVAAKPKPKVKQERPGSTLKGFLGDYESSDSGPDPVASAMIEGANILAQAQLHQPAPPTGYRPIPEGNGGSGYGSIPSGGSPSRENNPAPILPGERTTTFRAVTNGGSSYNQACAGKTFGVGSRQARMCRQWLAEADIAPTRPSSATAETNGGSFYNQQPKLATEERGSATTGTRHTSANQCVGFDPAGYMTNSCNVAIEVAFCFHGAATDSTAYLHYACGKKRVGMIAVPASGRAYAGAKPSGYLSFFACEKPGIPHIVTTDLTGLRARGCR